MGSEAKPDFGKNVRGGGEIFRRGATIIYPSQQRVEIKNTLLLYILYNYVSLSSNKKYH